MPMQHLIGTEQMKQKEGEQKTTLLCNIQAKDVGTKRQDESQMSISFGIRQ